MEGNVLKFTETWVNYASVFADQLRGVVIDQPSVGSQPQMSVTSHLFAKISFFRLKDV